MKTKYRDIMLGQATVPYARASGNWPEGWALPGGKRTTNFEHALKVAKSIDQLIEKLKGKTQ